MLRQGQSRVAKHKDLTNRRNGSGTEMIKNH